MTRLSFRRNGRVLDLGLTVAFGLLFSGGMLLVLSVSSPPGTVRAEDTGIHFEILAFQPLADDYLFGVRLSGALPKTQYVITSYHHTDADYPQASITVTTDSQGAASARISSRYTHQDAPTGTVFARLALADAVLAESNHLDCTALCSIVDYGSYIVADPSNDDWIYRPSPPGSDRIRFWAESNCPALTGTLRIRSSETGYSLPEHALAESKDGKYVYTWSIAELPSADDYRVQFTLRDGADNLSGLDAFVKLGGRAMWVWGSAVGQENPAIWAILNNQDNDACGGTGRDEWLAFSDAPYGLSDPSAHTSYLSVYPYIAYTGTLVTETFQAFLTAVHSTTDIRVEALAGDPQWVETEQKLQDGKDLCDAILDVNRAGASPSERFDGIHYDLEHDHWNVDSHWARYIELLTYCQDQVDLYNRIHEPITFGVDVPPHFGTGPGSSGQIKSNWDVMNIVDTITLMDYRDYANVRWDGRTDGIIPRAQGFVADGNALGKKVLIGVELMPNEHNHVTFLEESTFFMESELSKVSRHFAGDWAYKGIAIHDYATWAGGRCAFLPLAIKNASP